MTRLIDYPDVSSRFIEGAWLDNQLIKDFPTFVDALNNYLGMERQGSKAIGLLNDSEYKELFENPKNLDRLKQRLDEKEYNEITEKTDHKIQGDNAFEVFVDKEKVRDLKPKDVRIIYTPKTINVSGGMRNGKPIKPYVLSRSKWGENERAYIRNLKNQGMKPKSIITEYRNRFKGSTKTSSAIKNQAYRVK